MDEPTILVTLASMGLVAISATTAAVLKGWMGWLELRRLELQRTPESLPPLSVADLKDRVRKLEAIAAGEA